MNIFHPNIIFLSVTLLLLFVLWLYFKSPRYYPDQHSPTSVSLGNYHKFLVGNDNNRRYYEAQNQSWIVRKLLASTGRYFGPILTYDLNGPLIEGSNNWTCVNTSTRPSFPICVYDPTEDRYVSAQLLSEGVWEPNITKLFQEALRYYPSATVIDLGAHIGSYALLAARSGHRVIAVEPIYHSIARLHKATQLANTSNTIIVIPAAVSDTHQVVTLRYKKGNVGGTSVRPVHPNEIRAIVQRDKFGVVKTVTLNDLADAFLNSSSTTLIMKMDIGRQNGYQSSLSLISI